MYFAFQNQRSSFSISIWAISFTAFEDSWISVHIDFSHTNIHTQKRLLLCITMVIKLILKHQGKKKNPPVFVWNEVFLNLRKSIIIQRAIKTWLRNEQFRRREGVKEAFIRHGGKSQRGVDRWDVQVELN